MWADRNGSIQRERPIELADRSVLMRVERLMESVNRIVLVRVLLDQCMIVERSIQVCMDRCKWVSKSVISRVRWVGKSVMAD